MPYLATLITTYMLMYLDKLNTNIKTLIEILSIYVRILNKEFFVTGFDGNTFPKLLVGRYMIVIQFIPTGSSQPLSQQTQEFTIYPTSECVTYLSSDVTFFNYISYY